jgi:hypothetical protein
MLYYSLFFIIGSEFEFLDTQNLIFKLFISKNTSKIITETSIKTYLTLKHPLINLKIKNKIK